MDQETHIKTYVFFGFIVMIAIVILIGVISLIAQFLHVATEEETLQADAESRHPGQVLVTANDCMTCHRIDQGIIGPSYREVAKRYVDADPKTIGMLVEKIQQGGSGNWGSVPMTAHPKLPDENVRLMIEWIFTLND